MPTDPSPPPPELRESCTECERLRKEQERLKQSHDAAILQLNAAAPGGNQGHFMTMKTLVEEAKVDLDAIDAEVARHQRTHA